MGSPAFTSQELRISSSGPTYFCPSSMILAGASAESSVPRPSIWIPETPDIFRVIAQTAGLSCSTSDKGLSAKSACQKLGGLRSAAQLLRSSAGRQFAAAFLDKTNPLKANI